MKILKKERENHSKMEDKKAESYAILADSKEYFLSYKKYINIIKFLLKKYKKLNILNIGPATGILEKTILNNIKGNISFTSIDNSKKFRSFFLKQNKNYIDKGMIEYVNGDINNYKFGKNFNIILSRDVNHHINFIEKYFKKIYNILSDDGIFIMEDLRHDADIKSIKQFLNLTLSIPQYNNDRINLYYKIIGLIESYLVSYTTEDIKKIIERLLFKYEYIKSGSRYHFCIGKGKSVFLKTIIKYFK